MLAYYSVTDFLQLSLGMASKKIIEFSTKHLDPPTHLAILSPL